MKINIKSVALIIVALMFLIASCKKNTYSLGELKAPTGLTLKTAIEGADANNPSGNGSGNVTITTSASNAITYKIDFGDGKNQVVPSGIINYKYSNPGTKDYTITINAIGTGGVISTISKKVNVYVAFVIPANMIQFLTNGSSKVWVSDHDAPGHVGVGPATEFFPIWYAATPNSRSACQYDDEITFSVDANNNINMSIDNKGQSFVIGASTLFYGVSGPDNCYNIDVSGTKKLVFMNATSGSNSSNSTGIQFFVPGNGLINFGTGANTYEILSISATGINLRNIGIDGNSWYQKLKNK